MNNSTAFKELNLDTYPVLPPTARRISRVCGSGLIGAPELAALINADPVLTAISYGLYNEFFPGDKKEFFGIPHIITVLSVNTVKNFILNVSMRALEKPEADACLERQKFFLRRSLAAGIISRLLATECGVGNDGLRECYCAGLLRDIGQFIVSGGGAAFNVKSEGVTALEAARLAAAHWGFPIAIKAVYNHDYGSRAAACAELADYLAEAAGFSHAGGKKPEKPEALFKTLSLPENIFEKIEAPFAGEMRKAQTFAGWGEN
jgi:HD-like signal output (HDOD) protein